MPQTEPTIANYDGHTAEEIGQRLRKLSQDDLKKLEAYEKRGQARRTVLAAIAALRADPPWSGYDSMEVEEVNEALKRRDGRTAERVLSYERQHKGRTTVIEFAKRRRDGSSGPPPPTDGKTSPANRSGSPKSSSSSVRRKTTSRRPSAPGSSASRARSRKPSATRSNQSAARVIPGYDNHTADEIAERLRSLSQSDLRKVEAYEKQGEGRSTVLEAIAALRGDEPWSGYDKLGVEQVNDALKRRDGETAARVLEYERHHKGRKTVIEFARARRQASGARSQSTSSSARPKAAARKRSPATARTGSPRRSASRPGTARSSGSQQTKSPQRPSGPRPQPRGASQPESRAREALQATAARLKERATEALRSAEGPTKKLAKDTGHAFGSAAQAAPAKIRERAAEALQNAERPAKKLVKETEQAVGSAAQDGRNAVGVAVRDTGQAVAAAASKAKTPALVGAATLAVGGGLALGSKVRPRRKKRVLGVPLPRRTAIGKAAKRVGRTVDGLSSTGQQIGQWSEDIQYLRQRIAGAGTAEKGSSRAAAGRIVC